MIALNRIERASLPTPQLGYQFALPARKWAFDFAWPDDYVALECEGATWSAGRHVRGSGYEADCEKYSTAAVQGWVVIRCTRAMVEDGRMVGLLQIALQGRQ